MNFVKTVCGGRKLLLSGYSYFVDKKVNDTTYWRCKKCKECSARLKTINDTVQSNVCDHSHPTDGARNSVLKVLDGMETKADHLEKVTSSLIRNIMKELPHSVAGALHKKETLERTI